MPNPPAKPSPTLVCPVPLPAGAAVQLGHGSGGRLSQQLLGDVFLSTFDDPELATLKDGAVLPIGSSRLALSTDSFVVHPLFFPGGDIGSLAVHGTVNDLCMCGARPIALSAGFILEEGLPLHTLKQVVASMQRAAVEAGVRVVTGDTKVVEHGKGDGLYINTAGVGVIPEEVQVAPNRARPGDRVLINGPIGEHGIAVLSVREGLAFESPIVSDCASLVDLVARMLAAGGEGVHVLRDPTRGGVATAVYELAASARVGVTLNERAIPVADAVHGACELLGLDPLYVANEGKVVAWVDPSRAEAVLEAMRAHPLGAQAAIIGEVTAGPPGEVYLRSSIGSLRVLDLLSGEQLPRIC